MAITQEISIMAYTEEDAIRQAMLQFKKVEKIMKVKAGFKPNKVKVENRKGEAKKWVTKHYLYTFTSKGFDENGEEVYLGMKLVEALDPGVTKADAILKAKEISVQTMKPVTIRLVKVLESGSNVVADVIPNGGVMGKYCIYGTPKTMGQMKTTGPVLTQETQETGEDKETEQE